MKQKPKNIIALFLVVIILIALFFALPQNKQSFLGSIISRFYPQVVVNYGECKTDSDCVVGIRLGSCCFCPEAVNKREVGKNGWELYDPLKKYRVPVGCNAVCEQCTDIVYTSCKNDQCVSVGLYEDISTLAQEYRDLREIKGHFDGGEWNDIVDKHGGEKHMVMNKLLEEIDKNSCDKSTIIHYLGEPDEIDVESGRNAPIYRERLVYYWRGSHDYIFFITKGNEVTESGWWYARE